MIYTCLSFKQLVLIKKKTQPEAFPKENAIYSSCRHRCDLCVHYIGGNLVFLSLE